MDIHSNSTIFRGRSGEDSIIAARDQLCAGASSLGMAGVAMRNLRFLDQLRMLPELDFLVQIKIKYLHIFVQKSVDV